MYYYFLIDKKIHEIKALSIFDALKQARKLGKADLFGKHPQGLPEHLIRLINDVLVLL
jgi:hypothetical protein